MSRGSFPEQMTLSLPLHDLGEGVAGGGRAGTEFLRWDPLGWGERLGQCHCGAVSEEEVRLGREAGVRSWSTMSPT